MITIILLILALNFFIILNYEKFVKFINIYDLPNTKIKKKKSSYHRWDNFISLIFLSIYFINYFF